MRRTVLAAVLLSLSLSPLAGCSAGGEPAPSAASGPSAPSAAGPSDSAPAGPTPVPTGKTFAWPDGLEATATVL